MGTSEFEKEKLFGTDGIRGTPGEYPLTDGMIFKIGASLAKILVTKNQQQNTPLKVVIGRDTRLTGKRIETILSDAIVFYGIDTYIADVITTPGLAYLVKELKAGAGIIVSASHNKASDNGIKFFNEKGFKLSCEEEERMENIILTNLIHTPLNADDKKVGKVHSVPKAQQLYSNFLTSTIEGVSLKGMHLALDCGHGAASGFAAKMYKKLGAQVISINDNPSGDNINMGGAIDPSALKALVLESKVDAGIAIDGDGDRCILIDEKGTILDGDFTMAMTAKHYMERGALPQNAIVITVMSNLGLRLAMQEAGGKFIITSVGDKYVAEELDKNGLKIGGEQSGHIIFPEYLPTPDALLTSLQVLKVMRETSKPLSELSTCMRKYPQILINIEVSSKRPFEDIGELKAKLDYFSKQLGDEGRILLRYSGTENLARVMVEGKDKENITSIANTLADIIRQEIGAGVKKNS